VEFVDGGRGWMGGNRLWRTDDGGWNWSEVDNIADKSLEGFHAVDAMDAWSVGDAGTIIHTTDGVNWRQEAEGLTRYGMKDVYFVDHNHGWIVGGEGFMFQYEVAVATMPPTAAPTSTPTPTRTATPTATPTRTPSPTVTPSTPWLAVGDPRVTFRVEPGGQTTIVVTYGNLTPGGMIDFTLRGPAVFADSGAATLSTAVNQARGRLDIVILADAAAEPGAALTIEARSGSARATHRGLIAYSARLPRVLKRSQ
jgi:hypothetical protein